VLGPVRGLLRSACVVLFKHRKLKEQVSSSVRALANAETWLRVGSGWAIDPFLLISGAPMFRRGVDPAA